MHPHPQANMDAITMTTQLTAVSLAAAGLKAAAPSMCVFYVILRYQLIGEGMGKTTNQ